MADDVIKNIRSAFPFPWGQVIHPNGLVQIIDSTGKEVPLFTLTEFATFLTNVIVKQKEAAAA